MATITTNDIVEVTMFGELQGSNILNVFHYVYTGSGVIAANYITELQAVIQSFRVEVWAAAANPLRDRFSTDYNLKAIRAQPVAPTRQFYVETQVNQPGTIAQVAAPADDQLTISYQTDRARRGATGNKRFTGLPTSQLDGGDWSLASQAAWELTKVKLLSLLDGAGAADSYRPTVWSPKRPGDRANVIGLVVRPQVRVTYSRTKGRGI